MPPHEEPVHFGGIEDTDWARAEITNAACGEARRWRDPEQEDDVDEILGRYHVPPFITILPSDAPGNRQMLPETFQWAPVGEEGPELLVSSGDPITYRVRAVAAVHYPAASELFPDTRTREVSEGISEELLDLPDGYELPPLSDPEVGCLFLMSADPTDSALAGWSVFSLKHRDQLYRAAGMELRTLSVLHSMAEYQAGE